MYPSLLRGLALATLAIPAFAADVGISLNVGQPGFFGQINIGNTAPPPVVYTQPVIIEGDARYAGAPIYLRVQPGYEQDWRRHCAEYRACGRPVYFVQDEWYQREYVRHSRDDDDDDDRGDDREHGHGHGRGHGRGHGHD